jgi:hypothetical protein
VTAGIQRRPFHHQLPSRERSLRAVVDGADDEDSRSDR